MRNLSDALNRAAVSADETSGSASTLGVSTKLFARNIGSKISTIHNDSRYLILNITKMLQILLL